MPSDRKGPRSETLNFCHLSKFVKSVDYQVDGKVPGDQVFVYLILSLDLVAAPTFYTFYLAISFIATCKEMIVKKPVYILVMALMVGGAVAVQAAEKQTQQPTMGPGMMGQGMMGMMGPGMMGGDAQQRWEQMQKNMAEMQKSKDPKQREKLMQQNMENMQQMMQMMHGMMGGGRGMMGMGPGMMGGYGYSDRANAMANMTNWMQSIETRLWMMQKMITDLQSQGKN